MRIRIRIFWIVFMSFTVSFFTSCISTEKLTSFVKPKFVNSVNETENSNIIFDFSKLDTIENIVQSEKLKSYIIPAILFWQWENNIKCQINPQSVGNMFKSYFIDYAKSLGLSEKLENQNLEIKIEKLPSSFIYVDKGYTIILIVGYSISELEAIYPEKQDIVIKYKLRENGQDVKSEELTIINKDTAIKNTWRTASTRIFTKIYVEQFEKNIKETAKEAVDFFLNNTK